MPPYLVSMRVVEEERTKFRLWFPLFLLWPLLLPLLLLTLIVTLFADLVDSVGALQVRVHPLPLRGAGHRERDPGHRSVRPRQEPAQAGPWPSRSARVQKETIMGDDRNRILDLLATGKITAEEAGRLLDALDAAAAQSGRRRRGGQAGDEDRLVEVHARGSQARRQDQARPAPPAPPSSCT